MLVPDSTQRGNSFFASARRYGCPAEQQEDDVRLRASWSADNRSYNRDRTLVVAGAGRRLAGGERNALEQYPSEPFLEQRIEPGTGLVKRDNRMSVRPV